jgi:hypothetical protein
MKFILFNNLVPPLSQRQDDNLATKLGNGGHAWSKRSILILSTHLCLGPPSGVFPSGFPTNNLYTFLFYT